MGLDMYLHKMKKVTIEQLEKARQEVDDRYKDLSLLCNFIEADGYTPIGTVELEGVVLPIYANVHSYSTGNFSYPTLSIEVGYWRKANAIHSWFVNNVQNGIDECETHIVSKEQLEKLMLTCEEVLATKNTSLLSPKGGFFFGTTSIDEWYWSSLANTITILTKVLFETDFDNEMITYHSSW